MQNFAYYPLDRLALILNLNTKEVLKLTWLSSRWGTFSYQQGRWREELPNQFLYKNLGYIHLDTREFFKVLRLFEDRRAGATVDDFLPFQVIYDFEFHEMFDVSMGEDGIRGAYEIYRWVNEFNDPSPVELEGEECHRAKYFGYYTQEIVEPEKARVAYEKIILKRRNDALEKKLSEKVSWIEGLPALNMYIQELYALADNRHDVHEIGQDYEDEWPYDANLNQVRAYLGGTQKLSINELQELASYLIKRYVDFLWPYPKVIFDVIAKPDEK
jgi:hypothetical protein